MTGQESALATDSERSDGNVAGYIKSVSIS